MDQTTTSLFTEGKIPVIVNGEKYTFCVERWEDHTSKIVAIGKFQSAAPKPCEPGVSYCLKYMTASNPQKQALPAVREIYDLLDFQGKNLRKILVRNDVANAVVRQLLEDGTFKGAVDGCISIEPLYQTLSQKYPHFYPMSASRKLEIIRGVGEALTQLSNNIVAKRKVLAYRDLKWANVMFDGDTVVLIDFATILLKKTESPLFTFSPSVSTPGSGTMKCIFSDVNTAIECVTGKFGDMSEKTDVFALGMMAASLFLRVDHRLGVCPSAVFYDSVQGAAASPQAYAAALEQAYREHNKTATPDKMWFESCLASHSFEWTADCSKEIKDLIFEATRILPQDRLSRKAFLEKLDKILIAVAKSQPKAVISQTPVQAVMVDCHDIYRWRERFADRIDSLIAANAEYAQRTSSVSPHYVLVAFNGDGTVITPPMNDRDAIVHFVLDLREADVRSTEDRYPAALFQTVKALTQLHDNCYFDGHISVFVPELPDADRYASVPIHTPKNGVQNVSLDEIVGSATTLLRMPLDFYYVVGAALEDATYQLPFEVLVEKRNRSKFCSDGLFILSRSSKYVNVEINE